MWIVRLRRARPFLFILGLDFHVVGDVFWGGSTGVSWVFAGVFEKSGCYDVVFLW